MWGVDLNPDVDKVAEMFSFRSPETTWSLGRIKKHQNQK